MEMIDVAKGTSTNAEWLAQVVEEPLDPDLPICDPHHHLWLTRPYGVQPRYMLEDFLGDIEESGHNVVSSVFVTCAATLRKDVPKHLEVIGETEFVNGIAAICASGAANDRLLPAAIVGTAYLRMHETVPDVLDMHLARGGDRFKGIRESAPWDASPAIPKHRTNPPAGLLLDADFRRGFAHLGPRGLSFEALINYPQIPDLIDLAGTFPDSASAPMPAVAMRFLPNGPA
jgi:L-fuconolactonase